MKNRKSILLLLLGLVLVCAAHVWLGRFQRLHTRIVRDAPLLDATVPPTSLTFVRPDARRVRLERRDVWRLTEPFAAAADEQAVLRLVDALSQTPLVDSRTDAELLNAGMSRADCRLEVPDLSVRIEGERPMRLDFGSPTPSSNGVYAASSAAETVGVLPMEAYRLVDLPLDALRRRALFSLDVDSVLAFGIKQGAERVLSFRRNGDQWKVGDEPASAVRVRALLDGILAAEAKGFVWPIGATNESQTATASLLAVYGLDPESAVTVTLTCVDGVARQVSFGLDAEDGSVYALAQHGGVIVTVDPRLRQLAAEPVSAFTDARLFPCESADVRAFSLVDGETTYTLARAGNDGWRLEAPVVAPADETTVMSLLDRLLALSTRDTQAAGVRVALTTNAEPVSVSRAAALGGLRLEDLRAREILKIDPVTVRRLVRTTDDPADKPSSVLYARDRKCWGVEGGTFKAGRVDEKGIETVLSSLSPLVADRIVSLKVAPADLAAYGLERPFRTLGVDREGAEAVRRNILVGGIADASGSRYATVGSTDAVFVLSAEVVDRLSAELVR